MYFIGDDELSRGPYSLDELREMIAARRLQPSDKIQRQGTSGWVSAGSMAELADDFGRHAIMAAPTGSSPRERPASDAITPARRRRDYDDDDDVRVPSIRNREIDAQLISSFRSQIHALGGFWIFIGSVAIIFVGVILAGNNQIAGQIVKLPPGADERLFLLVFATIVGGLALVYILIGILTCLKFISAVYVGLVLSYLSVLGQLANFNVCGLVILAVVIFQAHRVIGWASKMRDAGVPLDVKP